MRFLILKLKSFESGCSFLAMSSDKGSVSTKSVNSATWNDTFPAKFDEKNESDIFFLRCIYLVFVYIICKRKVLPSHLFKKRTIDGIIKTYVMNSDDKFGIRIANKFRALGEAIKLKFLDNESDVDAAVEVFTWKMFYSDDQTSASFLNNKGEIVASVEYTGLNEIKRSTRRLLYAIKQLCTKVLAPLPPNMTAGFRITYTNAAPSHYQAEGFYPSVELYHMDPRASTLELSNNFLSTMHHRCSVQVQSIYLPTIEGKIDNEAILDKLMEKNDDRVGNDAPAEANSADVSRRSSDEFEIQPMEEVVEMNCRMSRESSSVVSSSCPENSAMAYNGGTCNSVNTTLYERDRVDESMGDCTPNRLNESTILSRMGRVHSLLTITPENSP
ncbi:unnamed protein product [Auanema sp. JU1783]|nr:unnamed protein product [Auanema sp. JU1783]